LTWHGKALSGALYWNHVDSYFDRRDPAGPVPIAAWDTVDLSAQWKFNSDGGSGTVLNASIQNVFNRDPPRIPAINGNVVNFDSTNASIRGQFFGVELVHRW
jgi:outer membrane receptor protein involved in Fe transport